MICKNENAIEINITLGSEDVVKKKEKFLP
jgi:hypothetical protein